MQSKRVTAWATAQQHGTQETKAVHYAYPSSDLARYFGRSSQGCYVLRSGNRAKAFDDLQSLDQAYANCDLPTAHGECLMSRLVSTVPVVMDIVHQA